MLRRRHPFDRGWPFPFGQDAAKAFRALLDSRTWRRHPKPFAKTKRGQERHETRQHTLLMKQMFVELSQ